MTTTTCSRAALVEAHFDGRLGPAEEASVARHVEACASCAALHRELGAVREALRAAAPRITPLEHRRARLGLLRAAATPTARRPRAWRVAIGLALVPVVGWAAASVVGREARLEPRVLDAAPEVTRELPEVTPVRPRPLERAPAPEATPARPPSPPRATTPPRDDASRRFAEAMNEVARGDFAAAARDLDAFARSHPDDPRAEEAVYLQAIALERAGRSAEASRVARDYLARYPSGAHREPAHRLAGE